MAGIVNWGQLLQPLDRFRIASTSGKNECSAFVHPGLNRIYPLSPEIPGRIIINDERIQPCQQGGILR
ncbi:hypothetical protein D3C77_781360 [compost metagenome]